MRDDEFHEIMPETSAMKLCARCGRQFLSRQSNSGVAAEAGFQRESEMPPLCPQCEQELHTRAEQRERRRLQRLASPTVALIAINVVIYLAMVVQSHSFFLFDPDLLLRWGANSGALTAGGQWWRLLTSTFEHGGLLHIALNMWCLYNLGWLAELLFGRRRFTLLYLLCGIGGSLGSICWRGNGLSVGASGAIFGIAGALIPAMMLHGNPQLRAALKSQLSSIALFVLYNLAFGAAVPGIDNAAHIGGLLTGFVLGAAFPTGNDRRLHSRRVRAAIGTVLVLAAFAGAAAFAREHNRAYIEAEQASNAYRQGDLNAAIAHAERAVALKPQDAHAQFVLGTLYLNQKRYADALSAFTSTTRLLPEFGPAYVNLCVAQLAMKQIQPALANCERGTKLSPKDSEPWFNLGRARYAMHDLTGARDALAKAVELNPQGFDENLQYALLLIANGEIAKANPYLQKAHQLRPDDQDVDQMLQQLPDSRLR